MNTFEMIMSEFRQQSSLMRWAIRQYASDCLVQEGASEVGSSDVNAKIVQLHHELGSFGSIVIEALHGTQEHTGAWTLTL